MILGGDLGGTKANLGLFDVQNGSLVRVAFGRYASHEHAGLQEMVQDFLQQNKEKVTAACFGIAGPVVNNKVHITNLPWGVDGDAMAQFLGIERVRLLNDLEATGYGIEVMTPKDIETIHAGDPKPEATRVVIAAGTGLGEAILFWDGKAHLPVATEGGHSDFAPQTEQQAELWKFLSKIYEFVSNETILAGRGFLHLHEFLDPSVRHPGFDDSTIDPAPEITRRAMDGSCPVCVSTLDLWVEIYGSEAGNLAVRTLSRGGIYVAGGIAAKILSKLKDGTFAAAAVRKEKMGEYLKSIPIYVVLNEECPLMGTAYAAWKGL
jgi:glucokinase